MGEAARGKKGGKEGKENRLGSQGGESRVGSWRRETQERGKEEEAEGRQRGRQIGETRGRGERDLARAGPRTETGGEVWAGAVSRRTDALERAVGVGTDAALAEVLLAAFVHVCGTMSATASQSPSLPDIPDHAPPPPFPGLYGSETLTPSPTCLRLLPFLQAPPPRRAWLEPVHSLPNLSRLRPFPLSSPTPPLPFPSLSRFRPGVGTDRGKRLRGVRAGSRGHKYRRRSRRC